jgi:putative superfamily III holin-X
MRTATTSTPTEPGTQSGIRERKDSASLTELFATLVSETRLLLRQEVQLVRLEVAASLNGFARSAGLLGAGAALALGALLATLVCTIALLATLMPVWIAALLCATVLAAAAALLIRRGLSLWHAADAESRGVIETVRADVSWPKKHD